MKNTKTKTGQNAVKKETATRSKQESGNGLRNLFHDELKDIYWAESALTKALPKMIDKATSEELVDALTEHLEVTKEQVVRLEEVFSVIGEKAESRKCEAMIGLIKETEEMMGEAEDGVVRDAAIILCGQKVEHYEIATYGTLVSFARILGEEHAASLLEETLNEEKEADQKLSEIAETSVNIEAAE